MSQISISQEEKLGVEEEISLISVDNNRARPPPRLWSYDSVFSWRFRSTSSRWQKESVRRIYSLGPEARTGPAATASHPAPARLA